MSSTNIETVESNFLAWVTASYLFLAVAGIMRHLTEYGLYYSFIFWIITAILFLSTFLEYRSARAELVKDGVTIPWRLDLLAWISIVVIIVALFVIYHMGMKILSGWKDTQPYNYDDDVISSQRSGGKLNLNWKNQ